jgi:hypothetical protein
MRSVTQFLSAGSIVQSSLRLRGAALCPCSLIVAPGVFRDRPVGGHSGGSRHNGAHNVEAALTTVPPLSIVDNSDPSGRGYADPA